MPLNHSVSLDYDIIIRLGWLAGANEMMILRQAHSFITCITFISFGIWDGVYLRKAGAWDMAA
jgi:hypothetical protein